MTADHTPAWALIPWYGDDGLGAPTLDDWQVWVDWLRAHDPNDERDAAIAAALQRSKRAVKFVAQAYSRAHCSHGRLHVGWGSVRPMYDGGRAFIGFEVQPTRREMRHNFDALLQAMGVAPFGPSPELHRMALEADRQAAAARIIHKTASAFASTPAAAHALDQALRHVNATAQGAPRNPRRRGDTGAHGRARR